MSMEQDLRSSVEAMFFSPNYCDLYMHINQVRGMLGLDKVLLDDVIVENKWVAEQFRKYVGSHQLQVLGKQDYNEMLDAVESMIDKAEETNTAPRELLYMYMRDEWLSQLHAVIANAIEVLGGMDDEEDYDA